MHSTGAIFCQVGVNAVTGETRVRRLLGSYDCGRIINPKTAASQFRGGIIMGIGLALMEDTEFDERTGRIMNPSLAEYHVPVQMDVPAIELMWTDIPDPHAPAGARGIGEYRDHRRRRGDRQRDLQRDRSPGARPADHAGQAAVTARARPR